MAPLLVASPTKMNVLYRGVDNPIELSVPGVPPERVQAGISTGRIVRSGQGWVASGMSGSTAEVFATVTLPDGSTRRVGPMRFRVKDLPAPMPIVAGKTPRDSRVRKAELMAAQGVAARLEDTDFEAPWVVKRFKIVAVRGARVIEMESTSNTFTPQMRELIADLRPGEQVYVEGVKAQLANGSGPVRELPSLGFRVVQ
jgi:gliding motility-associated protein GldM